MASAARLERLRKLIQAEVDALPERSSVPIVDGGDTPEGAVHEPPIDASSQQTTTGPPQLQAESTIQELSTNRWNTRTKVGRDTGCSHDSASIPTSVATTSLTLSAPLPATKLNRGDLAQAQQYFTPIQALAKYPYRFCNRSHQQDVASAFFDQGKFWAREWDL